MNDEDDAVSNKTRQKLNSDVVKEIEEGLMEISVDEMKEGSFIDVIEKDEAQYFHSDAGINSSEINVIQVEDVSFNSLSNGSKKTNEKYQNKSDELIVL